MAWLHTLKGTNKSSNQDWHHLQRRGMGWNSDFDFNAMTVESLGKSDTNNFFIDVASLVRGMIG